MKGDRDQPMKSMSGLPTTIKAYRDAQQIWVPINPLVRNAIPNISRHRNCQKCNKAKHDNAIRCEVDCCKNCNSTDHTTDKCKNQTRCANCFRSHRSDSEKCEIVRRLTYSMNEYAMSILLGEQIITNEAQVLRDPEAATAGNVQREDIAEIVTEMIAKNELIISMNERLIRQEEETQLIKGELSNLALSDARILEQVNTLKIEAEKTKIELKNDIETAKTELSQAVSITSIKQDESSSKLDILLELMKQMAPKEKIKTKRDLKN